MGWVAALGSIAGGYLGSQNNGEQQTTKPWKPLQPYLQNLYASAGGLANIPQQYYPGQGYVGALPEELAAYGNLAGYNQQMFGAPNFMQQSGYPQQGGYPAGGGGVSTMQPYQPANAGYAPPNAGYAPPNAGYGGSSMINVKGRGDSGSILTPFGGGTFDPLNKDRPRKYGGAINPATGTVDVQGGGPRADELMSQYLQTGEWGGNGAGKKYGRLRSAVDELRNTGWTYNQSSGTAPGLQTPPTGATTMGLDGTSKLTNPNYASGMPTYSGGLGGFQPTSSSSSGSPFGTVMGGLGSAVGGTDTLGQMGQALAPGAVAGLQGTFGQGPGQVGRYGFDTTLNPNAMTPQFGQAGSLDATSAFQKALSGTPDYAGLQGSIDAANAPILRQLNEQIIPGLNQKATFLNNETGGIKALNRVLPEVGERMSLNANTLYEGERQRALASQQAAANSVGQGGLGAYGYGLQGATTQAGLQQALAGQNLATDTTNAGLQGQYRGDMLGLGNLAGGLAGDQATSAARWGALFPSLASAGAQPYQDALSYGTYQRGINEMGLTDSMNRYNFQQQEPYNRYGWLAGLLGGLPSGSVTNTQTGNSATGTIGGAITGGQLASMLYGAYNPGLGGTVNNQGLGLSQQQLNGAYGQLDALNLYGGR